MDGWVTIIFSRQLYFSIRSFVQTWCSSLKGGSGFYLRICHCRHVLICYPLIVGCRVRSPQVPYLIFSPGLPILFINIYLCCRYIANFLMQLWCLPPLLGVWYLGLLVKSIFPHTQSCHTTDH